MLDQERVEEYRQIIERHRTPDGAVDYEKSIFAIGDREGEGIDYPALWAALEPNPSPPISG